MKDIGLKKCSFFHQMPLSEFVFFHRLKYKSTQLCGLTSLASEEFIVLSKYIIGLSKKYLPVEKINRKNLQHSESNFITSHSKTTWVIQGDDVSTLLLELNQQNFFFFPFTIDECTHHAYCNPVI